MNLGQNNNNCSFAFIYKERDYSFRKIGRREHNSWHMGSEKIVLTNSMSDYLESDLYTQMRLPPLIVWHTTHWSTHKHTHILPQVNCVTKRRYITHTRLRQSHVASRYDNHTRVTCSKPSAHWLRCGVVSELLKPSYSCCWLG